MKALSLRLLVTFALLAVGFLLTVPERANGHRSGWGRRSSFYYTTTSNVFRGQLALEREGHLEKGKYEPGRYDPPTREAIRDFQRRHRLWSNGRFDYDTFAMLPVDDRPDKDDDGIPDADDRCPETKKGTRVDYDGCTLKKESSDKGKD